MFYIYPVDPNLFEYKQATNSVLERFVWGIWKQQEINITYEYNRRKELWSLQTSGTNVQYRKSGNRYNFTFCDHFRISTRYSSFGKQHTAIREKRTKMKLFFLRIQGQMQPFSINCKHCLEHWNSHRQLVLLFETRTWQFPIGFAILFSFEWVAE